MFQKNLEELDISHMLKRTKLKCMRFIALELDYKGILGSLPTFLLGSILHSSCKKPQLGINQHKQMVSIHHEQKFALGGYMFPRSAKLMVFTGYTYTQCASKLEHAFATYALEALVKFIVEV